MKARKCDRCGKFYENDTNALDSKKPGVVQIWTSSGHILNTYDVCEECAKEVQGFIESEYGDIGDEIMLGDIVEDIFGDRRGIVLGIVGEDEFAMVFTDDGVDMWSFKRMARVRTGIDIDMLLNAIEESYEVR